MQIKKLLIISNVFILFLSSCQYSNPIEKILVKNKEGWNLLHNDTLLYGIKFYKKGKCDYFNVEGGSMHLLIIDDFEERERSYSSYNIDIESNTFEFDVAKLNIVKVTNDSILLHSIMPDCNILLVRRKGLK